MIGGVIFKSTDRHERIVPVNSLSSASYGGDLTPSDLISMSTAIRPLRSLAGARYCSSSVINHRGARYTVTNRHCCEAQLSDGMLDGMRQVGDTLEKIIYVSQSSDLCILATNHPKGLDMARRPIGRYQKTIVIGFPQGQPMTVYEGRYQYAEEVCIEYAEFPHTDVRCVNSLVHSTRSYPGNSGSAMFNAQGEVIGVLYGGSSMTSITVTQEQLKQAPDTARVVQRQSRYGSGK